MKTLPDNPNLDHLRRQARELLTGLRDAEPDTGLADAQRLLATQYGFRTWTELKAEVDRCAGTAEIAGPDLARTVADRFGLGVVVGDMVSLARADEMGRRWSIRTAQGRWVARTVDDQYPVSDGELDVALQEAATRAGVDVPTPVRSRAGAIVEVIDGHRWRVTGWAHSAPPLVAPVGAETARTVGSILATIHGLGLPADRLSPWHSMRLATLGWAELADKATQAGVPWAAVLVDAVPVLDDLDELGGDGPGPATVLTHASLFPANLRRGGTERLVVSGWDHATGLPPAWELGEVLQHWVGNPGGPVNVAGATALAAGYRSVAGSLPPLDLAMFRGAAVSLLNYVSGQVWLALEADTDSERRYTERNVRHLLTHLPSRAMFSSLLEAAQAPPR